MSTFGEWRRLACMKLKHTLLLLIAGLGLGVLGALWKILHYPYADILILASLTLNLVAVLIGLYKIVSHPKVKAVLNR